MSRYLPVPRNLPNSSSNVPNRHKKSNSPKKAKGLGKRPKIKILASKKPSWQLWLPLGLPDVFTVNLAEAGKRPVF